MSTSAADDVDKAVQFVLTTLDKNGNSELTTLQVAKELNIDHQAVVGAIKSLLTHDGIILTSDASEKSVKLTNEGNEMAEKGSAEYRVYEQIGADGALQADIMKQPFGKVGVNKALAAGWIYIDKSG
ncbi:unnamed protein product, partial [Cylicostephanus goldi]